MKSLRSFLAVYPVKYRAWIIGILIFATVACILCAVFRLPEWLRTAYMSGNLWFLMLLTIYDNQVFGGSLSGKPVDNMTYLKTSSRGIKMVKWILTGEVVYRFLLITVMFVVALWTTGVTDVTFLFLNLPVYLYLWLGGYGVSSISIMIGRRMNQQVGSGLIGVAIFLFYIALAIECVWKDVQNLLFAAGLLFLVAGVFLGRQMIQTGMERKKEEYYDA